MEFIVTIKLTTIGENMNLQLFPSIVVNRIQAM